MRLAGVGTTGSRTLPANGIATAVKVASTEWLISGVGLSVSIQQVLLATAAPVPGQQVFTSSTSWTIAVRRVQHYHGPRATGR